MTPGGRGGADTAVTARAAARTAAAARMAAGGTGGEISRYLSPLHRGARFVAQRLALAPVIAATLDVEVRGTELLDGLTGPYVLVANHTSHLDAALLVTRLPWRVTRDLALGAAADYFHDVRWRRVLTGLFFNTFPIDRTGSGTGRGLAFLLVDAGVPVVVFPEGTRSRDGRIGPFSPGAALVARRGRVPCVPVAIRGAHDAMPAGSAWWPRPGRPPVRLVVGEPIVARKGERIPDFAARIEHTVRRMHADGRPLRQPPADNPAATTGPASGPPPAARP